MIAIESSAQYTLIVVSVVFAVISTTAVCLRIFARHKKRLRLEWDDYFIIIALVRNYTHISSPPLTIRTDSAARADIVRHRWYVPRIIFVLYFLTLHRCG